MVLSGVALDVDVDVDEDEVSVDIVSIISVLS